METETKEARKPGALQLTEDREETFEQGEGRWYRLGMLKKGVLRGRRLICYEDHEEEEVAEFLDGPATARVKLAPIGSQQYQQYISDQFARYDKLRRRNGGVLPPKLVAKIVRQACARHVLLDWSGVALPDGSTPDYGPAVGETALELNKAFANEISETARDLADEIHTRDEEDAESLGNGSSGSSSGVPTPTN
jgi:hypothetical protein